MARKPFYREFDGCWYVQTHVGSKRKQVKLRDDKGDPIRGHKNAEVAEKAFYKFMALEPAHVPEPTALKVCNVRDQFLIHAEKHNNAKTFAWYKKYLQSFNDLFGTLGALEVKPIHVTRWLDAHPKWKGSRRCAVIALKRAYNWCEEQELIPTNPIKKVKKPKAVRRERILTAEERMDVFQAIRDREFRDFVFALQETGCRPGVLFAITDLGKHVAGRILITSAPWRRSEINGDNPQTYDTGSTKEFTGAPRHECHDTIEIQLGFRGLPVSLPSVCCEKIDSVPGIPGSHVLSHQLIVQTFE